MSQDELGCRVDFLLDHCFQIEREEMETMENVNKLLLQNVLPLHVASFFMGKTVRNQVMKTKCSSDVKFFLSVICVSYLASSQTLIYYFYCREKKCGIKKLAVIPSLKAEDCRFLNYVLFFCFFFLKKKGKTD